ncbi:helicase-related protein [Paenibacillus sp. RC84]|uniref:helicase-related protein n=1 Tax=Paenibacillus sp. RC84 TaxID=3156252 RepID=UPI0035195F79
MRDTLLDTRKDLFDQVKKELLGPGSEYSIPDEEHEIITDLPEVRYSVGVLFPQKNLVNADNNQEAVPKTTVQEENEGLIEEEPLNDFDAKSEKKKRYLGNVADDSENGSLDEDISLSMQNMPSSVGMTFFVDQNCETLSVKVSFATYRKALLEDCKLPFTPENADSYILPTKVIHMVEYQKPEGRLVIKGRMTPKEVTQIKQSDEVNDDYLIDCLYRLSNQFTKGYVRNPHEVDVNIKFTNNYFEKTNLSNQNMKCVAIKRPTPDGLYAITILLVNMNTGAYNGTNSFFQPRILANTGNNKGIRFKEYTNREYAENGDLEEKGLDLLYRDKKVYATGHGVSSDWNVIDTGEGQIWTEFMPTFEVPQMDFSIRDKRVNINALSMKYLSDLDSTERNIKIAAMKGLIDAYSTWISDIEKVGKSLDKKFQDAVDKHTRDCKDSCGRMYHGLKLLEEDDKIYDAFQLANRAMFMQRIHSAFQREDHYPGDIELQERMESLDYFKIEDKEHKWRPFQLAFLLMSLRSIAAETSDERDLVDLIWFPTGGGKTEAYLGLTAFTIFYRRLTYLESSNGTTVIMRYTLRLLAAQQFLRAGTLICACESIRRDCERRKSRYPKHTLGKERITIGLWIGGTHTPNKNDNAKQSLEKLLKASSSDLRDVKDKHNKFQILKCPWCGTKLVRDHDATGKGIIGQWGYMMEGKNNFRIYCPQESCEFESALPIQIVDEELYKSPPTLLFGTVDKFAMLPWKNEAGSFFAATHTTRDNRTPELIIQDELHLISGPLGTIVGLYETAIDALCSVKGVKPKIIASTATIRRAKDQCSNLFNRDVCQFPAPGIDASDSFFAREAETTEKPGRKYVGIMPSGKTKAMMEVRSIASILQRVHMMNIPDEVKDKFWTLAVYFNSLRDLSKCSTLVDDDVKDFLRRTAYRFGNRNLTRQIGSADELTSRISTSQLNETLEKLEQVVYSNENIKDKKYPINVLLATNMISVGVDVARLNVMLLVGQPKLTSEYIQASSRIGRTYPGIAFVLYDGAKSRDRSHYEQFRSYHESFYKFVEPTGATPFSKPARDRALHAVMVTLMRHKYQLSQDNAAQFFQRDEEATKEIESYILTRVNEVKKRADIELKDETEEILREMSEFWDDWADRINRSSGTPFYYGDRYIVQDPPSDSKRLLKVFGNESSDSAKETLTSMRNVDRSVTAGLIIWE